MIVGISIKNFKSIQEVTGLPLSRFHVLVGPNGVGKSTFLDAIDFVRDCLVQGPAMAVEIRHITDFDDLTWMRQGGAIGVELWFDLSDQLPKMADSLIRYRLAIKQDQKLGVCVDEESLSQYPKSQRLSSNVIQFESKVELKLLLAKSSDGTDMYKQEREYNLELKSDLDYFNFGPNKLTLAHTPPDEKLYPTANAVRRFLMQGVRYIQLDSPQMRLPCPATRPSYLELDGTNLARVVGRLLGSKDGLGPHWAEPGTPVSNWTEHIRYALPDLVNIGWARRQVDNAEYLMLQYENGLEAPSWVLSDGTLRMLALTLPAFLPPEPALYMVEEPENGVHPKALEIILRSLSTVPAAQVLLATHSPLVVQQCGIEPLLCFSRDADGTHIIGGPHHPMLQDWDGTPDLGTVFAAGVLE